MSSRAHVIAFPCTNWSHTKPLLVLLAKMTGFISVDEVALTLLVGGPALPKLLIELESMPQSIVDCISIIDIGPPTGPFQPQLGYKPIFEKIWAGQPVLKLGSSEPHAFPKPSVVIIDPINGYAISTIKELSAGLCPILTWYTFPVSSLMGIIGPEHLGGVGDLAAKVESAVKETGKTAKDVADSVYYKYEGSRHHIPGVPPLYDYDLFPQELILPFPIAMVNQFWHRITMSCDGVIVVASSAFETESVEAGRAWLESSGKDLFVIGPLDDTLSLPSATHSPRTRDSNDSQERSQIITFLNDMQAKHGPGSVIYLSFGTTFYPKDSCKLEAVTDEILASGTPILWSHASPFAGITPSLEEKFAGSPNAFHTSWVSQREVLAHPATGWFLSHGGWNSVQEALRIGVPMIIWPFAADQPVNAAILCATHGAAFELYSVRSGKGAQQPRRLDGQKQVDFTIDGVREEVRDLLIKLRGPEGAEVRKNAGNLGAAMAASWAKDGEASLQIEAFLSKYVRSRP